MTLVNLTGKPVTIMDDTKTTRLCLQPDLENTAPVCEVRRIVEKTITADGVPIEIIRNQPTRIKNLPAPQEGLSFVVNLNIAVYAKLLAGKQPRTDLLVPNDPVFDATGQTVGYKSFLTLA